TSTRTARAIRARCRRTCARHGSRRRERAREPERTTGRRGRKGYAEDAKGRQKFLNSFSEFFASSAYFCVLCVRLSVLKNSEIAERLQRREPREIGRALRLRSRDRLANVRIAPDRALQPADLLQRVVHAVVARVMDRLLGAPDRHRRL